MRTLCNHAGLVRELTEREVRVQFLTAQLTFSGEHSPMVELLLSVLGAFAQFERALIRERQREGIALAKARGLPGSAYRGLRASPLSRVDRRGRCVVWIAGRGADRGVLGWPSRSHQTPRRSSTRPSTWGERQ